MTDVQIGLTVMSAVVAAVSVFGAVWLRVERAQARKTAKTFAAEQGYLPFAEGKRMARMEEITHPR